MDYMTKPMIFNSNNEQLFIYGEGKFPRGLTSIGDRFIKIPGEGESRYSSYYKTYDLYTKKYLAIGKTPLSGGLDITAKIVKFEEGYRVTDTKRPQFIIFDASSSIMRQFGCDASYSKSEMIYNTETGEFAVCKQKGFKDCPFFDIEESDGGIFYYAFDKFDSWEYSRQANVSWQEAYRERKNHQAPIDFDNLKYYQNNLPINNEHGKVDEPSVNTLNESDIRRIVSNAIRRLINE